MSDELIGKKKMMGVLYANEVLLESFDLMAWEIELWHLNA